MCDPLVVCVIPAAALPALALGAYFAAPDCVSVCLEAWLALSGTVMIGTGEVFSSSV